MNEEILFQYQVKTKSQYGTRFYYFYADTDIENYLNNKNIKYVRYVKDTALNKKEKRIRELFKENKQLQQENQSLKDRIEKAIEYIKTIPIGSKVCVMYGEECEYTEPLLEILKGDK